MISTTEDINHEQLLDYVEALAIPAYRHAVRPHFSAFRHSAPIAARHYYIVCEERLLQDL